MNTFGNRNVDEANTTTLPKNCGSSPNFTVCIADRKTYNPAVTSSNNRLSTGDGYAFDTSGNTTADAEGRTFIYDAENKQVEVKNSSNQTVGQYFYDGDGKRVKKYVPSTGETTIFVYDASGKLVAEYSTIVASTNDAQVAYLTNDHLGSPRVNLDKNGNITGRHDYHPFGDEIATSQRTAGLGFAGDGIRKQFTGYERDEETELDFAQARYHNSSLGRFSTPDPLMASAKAGNPQTWNRYSYTGNNPLCLTDPTGLTWFSQERDGKTYYQWFTGNPGEGWNRVTNFTYNTNDEHGWVALDPYSANWSDHHEDQADAEAMNSFSVAMWNTHQFLAGANDSFSSVAAMSRWAANRFFGVDSNIAESTGSYRAGWWTGFGTQIVAGAFAGGAGAAEEGAAVGVESALADESVTIIGEGMRRVETAARNTAGSVILNDMPVFEGQAHEVTSQMMTYNRQWILNQMRSGRPILDIGRDPSRVNPSIFYQMERNMVQNYLQLHPNVFTVVNP